MRTPTQTRPGTALVQGALALGGFAIGTAEFATMGILPLLSRDFGVSIPAASAAVGAYAIGVIVGAPTLAVLGARTSRRTMLLVLLAWFAAANLLSAVAPSFGSLLLLRFLSGLPHGAYFGLASLVAASTVPPEGRAVAVGRVLLGLSLATIVGVPLATLLADHAGWRLAYTLVGTLAAAGALAVWFVVPRDHVRADAAFLAELAALRHTQIWLTLSIGAIGFGGLFAIYTYLVPTLTAVTNAPGWAPVILALFGIGMTLGNLLVPRWAGHTPLGGAGALLLWGSVAAVAYTFAAHHLWSIALAALGIGFGGALGALLQTRLVDVAGEAQALAAALNHASFNTANALGPWLGGMAVAAGWGWTSTGWVAAGLALGGLAMWLLAVATDPAGRHHRARHP